MHHGRVLAIVPACVCVCAHVPCARCCRALSVACCAHIVVNTKQKRDRIVAVAIVASVAIAMVAAVVVAIAIVIVVVAGVVVKSKSCTRSLLPLVYRKLSVARGLAFSIVVKDTRPDVRKVNPRPASVHDRACAAACAPRLACESALAQSTAAAGDAHLHTCTCASCVCLSCVCRVRASDKTRFENTLESPDTCDVLGLRLAAAVSC